MLTCSKRVQSSLYHSLPRASAVLVRDGVVLEVGRMTMAPWLRGQDYVVTINLQTKSFARDLLIHFASQYGQVLLPMNSLLRCVGNCPGEKSSQRQPKRPLINVWPR